MKWAHSDSHFTVFGGEYPFVPVPRIFLTEEDRGCCLSAQEVDSSPTVRTVWVTPDSSVYSVPIPNATRDSPSEGCGTCIDQWT